MLTRHRRTGLAVSALALALAAPGVVLAQTAPAADAPKDTDLAKANDTIVVTGTRLSGKVTDQPIAPISGDLIASQGYTNVGQALTDLPMFGIPANSPAATQGSFGAGQTFLNLYNLGAQRTLTLVNGNRFVGAATSSIFGAAVGSPVDLGQIAPSLVDHIDVVSVGGAPIYGSDAIAGTVNIVLKKHYEGIELDGTSGISGVGDDKDYNFSLLVGKNFAGGRGNITLNVYYDHQDGIATSQRYVTSADAPFFGATTAASGPQNVAYFGGEHWGVVTNTGIPTVLDNVPFPNGVNGGAADPIFGAPWQAVTNAAGQGLFFNAAGHLVPFNHGTFTGDNQNEAGGDGFRTADYGNLLTSSHRLQGTLLLNYDVSDHISVHGEAWLSTDTASNVSNQTLYNTALFSGPGGAGLPYANYIVSSSNPFLSAADQATIQNALAAAGQPTNQFYLARANTDLYAGGFTTRSDLMRFVGGINGDFHVGSHKFQWDATVTYGQTNTLTSQPGLAWQNIQNAVNAVQGPGGSIICAPGYTNAPIATHSSTCAPLDLFGVNHVSAAALAYITADANSNQVNKQFDAVADVKGDIIHLPGGDVKASLGVEVRRESQAFDPGAFFSGSYSQYAVIAPVSGSYHTHEAFGELTVPVVGPDMHVPLVHSLAFHGAGRYTNNSVNGGFWSYTGGGDYSPVSGVTLRGNFTRSFRQPAVTEAYSPLATVFEAGNDPCDARFITGGSSPATRAANCAKAGVPAGFASAITGATAQGLGGGNPHLQNEIANSWTVGAAIAPHFIPGLNITADYIHINIEDEILQPGVQALMQACYDAPNFPNSPFCADFVRDPNSHQITSFVDQYTNIGTQSYRAIQANVSYRFPLRGPGGADLGRVNISAYYLHELRNDYVVGTGSTQYDHDQIGEPADSVTTMIDWSKNKVDWSWTFIYDGPTKVNPNNPPSTYQYYRVSPYWMINTAIGVRINEHFSLRAIVNNVFNLGVTYAGTVPQFSTNKEFDAIIGRSFRINASVKF